MTKQGLQRQFLSGRGSLSHKPFTCRGHRDNNAESLIRKSFSDSLRCNGILEYMHKIILFTQKLVGLIY